MKFRASFVGLAFLLSMIFIMDGSAPEDSSRDPASLSGRRYPHRSLRKSVRVVTTSPTPPPADLPILLPEDRPHSTLETFKFPLVLMFHDIVATSADQVAGSDVTESTFKAEMHLLKSRGYTTLSLDELHDAMIGNTVLPERSVLLTFDDGYIGSWTYAYPYMKQENMKGAFFVHTNYVGTQTEKLHISWDQLRVISEDPLFKVMPHTLTHPDLTSLTMDQLIKEVRDSRAMLELMLGGSHPYFAYPYGRNGPASISVTRQYYDMAFVVGTSSPDHRIEAAYQIPRLSMVKTQTVEQFGQAIQAFSEDPEANPLR